ncbi:MAG TPA: Hsp70 family protein [Chthoniobacterales bacterium]|jgi:molecular chaperone DnaK (HSP70)|nr:Hsp70 family protein [Chthoniobacterales bacterium]
MSKLFSLGIDLGTTNSAIAIEELETGRAEIVEITQLLGVNQIGERSTLPSALYIPHPDEFKENQVRLPWSKGEVESIIGHFARNHGALIPDRLITSAKSWLSNFHVDPKSPVLPWKSDIKEQKLSAFDCSRRYLEHLKEGFLYAESRQGRTWKLADGQVVLTVPASFDEIARNLTAAAAEAAGFEKVVLVEEPQAAFYAWTAQAGSDWRTQVSRGDIVLVCDIGGGTADFSLIAVTEKNGDLELERISVGEHILLGGDNMDLALAYTLQAQLEAAGKSIDSWQFLALTHAASAAKINLFADTSLDQVPVAVPSRGSSLLAKTVSSKLTRAALTQVIVEGFFPITSVSDLPKEMRTAALQEFGLPYASEPVVSKHLARFLTRSLINVKASEALTALVKSRPEVLEGSYLRPTAVLFNGGVFNAAPIRQRILDILTSWGDGKPVRELAGFQPDLAVAKGAALYGRNRATGKGIRIKAGTARSYYIGLESSAPAVPGFKPPIKALCVVPQGMEEGSELLIDEREFGLITGLPADFRFFASAVRSGDKPGTIVANAERELEETGKIEVTLPAVEGFPQGQPIPVLINPIVTELGNLELWMKHTGSDRRWKVEYQVRME